MSDSFSIGKVRIGGDAPCVVIAEIADSHLGRVDVARRLIEEAKKAGADFAKFQLHLPDVEMVPGSITMWDGPLYDILKRNLLSIDQHRELRDHCAKVGIEYLCTPFCAPAADLLDSIGVGGYKTGSGEMTNLPMLRQIARKKKPMIVSTGMCTLDEIDATVAVLREEKATFALTNCTSEYPAKYEHINLPMIRTLAERYKVVVGHSDHTVDSYTAFAAVATGAKIIEKHFTLSKDLPGPDHFISLVPEELAALVDGIRKTEKAMTPRPKAVTAEEQKVREWAHHSVVAAADVAAGTTLSAELVTVKRPGSGIPAAKLGEVVGRTAKRALKKDAILKWDDLS